MPRDGAGNYTLAAGNPVAGGTIISVTWANPTMDDIKTALTDSLSRTGLGGMLVPFLNADGTVLQPRISFSLEPNSGLYRAGTSDVRMTIGAEDTTRWIDATTQPVGEQSPFEIWNGASWATVLYQGSPLLLENDEFVAGRNFANSADLGIAKINPSDQIEFGPSDAIFPGSVTVSGTLTADLTGNAATASKWATARTLTLGGDLTGSVAFDGSANFTLNGSVVANSHTHTGTTISALDAGDTTTGVFDAARIPTTLPTLKVSDLAGTGTRNVGADASGELVIDDSGGGGSGFHAMGRMNSFGTVQGTKDLSISGSVGNYTITLTTPVSSTANMNVLLTTERGSNEGLVEYTINSTTSITVNTNAWNGTAWNPATVGFSIGVSDMA